MTKKISLINGKGSVLVDDEDGEFAYTNFQNNKNMAGEI